MPAVSEPKEPTLPVHGAPNFTTKFPAPSPGRTPHDLSLWLADWFKSMGGSEGWRRPKITHGVTTHCATMPKGFRPAPGLLI
jgi:hypothetical protein